MSPQTSYARFARPLAWISLVLAAVFGAGYWAMLGRPVDLPDSPTAKIACVSYAPYRLKGETPFDPHAVISPERIDADLKALSTRFDCVRTYSMGQGLGAVPDIAGRYGMKVLMGIWLGRDTVANEREIALGLDAARRDRASIRGIVVGNEVLLRGELSEKALADAIQRVNAATDVPVTYADVWEFWQRHPQLVHAVDYVTIHILPYWEDEPVAPEKAVQHVADVYRRMKAEFPGKQVMIGETGWPSEGRTRRDASASLVNEARYLREFLNYAATVDMPYNVIEAFDQPWKRDLEGTVGGYWGIFDVNAEPKFAMTGPVVEEPRWTEGLVAGGVGALVFLVGGAIRRRWRGATGWGALALAGFASGTALAAHARLLTFSCRNLTEWTIGIAIGACALVTAFVLARAIAARLAAPVNPAAVAPRPVERRLWGIAWTDAFTPQRFFWMFVLTLYGLLMVFNGRYRDFPIGLFAMPCIGFFVLALLRSREGLAKPIVEERLLSLSLVVLAAAVVVQETGVNAVSWGWLLLNLALALPVLGAWWKTSPER
ncbi:Exo-beta-1,3-glucanase, GH17 family [Luteibacter sp. UNCMF331Sha3.1]|uniref:glycoside hydrolase family 17 protein n=1 Tax=Luteibacter sp. UNCMF331Sha3.1 TaxID=1502760 RepID=UPI0008D22330|nr:glycoside hydrolase family 17 [Luteibacter sp. UNCMF331Sha3.1]SEM43751.1 Exo-beta-1,3-glucanase, GH17 family [Luteibacter sp. UNCMF331Sha3.1]